MKKSRTNIESVKELQDRFAAWRESKPHARAPIPQRLWEAAARAARVDSVAHVSRALGLDYKALKKRVSATQSDLLAVNAQSAFVRLEATHRFSDTGCVVELEEVSGAKMTIRMGLEGATILPGLVEAFATQRQ